MSNGSDASPARAWWRVPLELKVLLGLLVIVGGSFVFLELGEAVRNGTTQKFDEWVLKQLRQPNDAQQLRGPKWLMESARDVTALGGYTVLTMMILVVCVFLGLIGNHVAWRFIAGASISGCIVGAFLKSLFSRPRPHVVGHLSEAFTSSFPSGHSMMSAVVYLTMGALLSRFASGRVMRIYCLGVAILLSFLVGCSRVMMGVHYPTDVLGGWSAGLVWATLCWLIARRWQKKHPESKPAA